MSHQCHLLVPAKVSRCLGVVDLCQVVANLQAICIRPSIDPIAGHVALALRDCVLDNSVNLLAHKTKAVPHVLQCAQCVVGMCARQHK